MSMPTPSRPDAIRRHGPHHARPGSPLDAFTGDIQRPRISPLYKAGLVITAFGMVLLPILYIALIFLTVWLVMWHIRSNAWILSASSGIYWRQFVFVTPAGAGGILLLFLIKPLFARKSKAAALPHLDPAREPLLFAFVQRISQIVGAPMPCRIEVVCEANASARLRRGLWSRDVVLTIGLPMAAGLDMQQFAGVLAHELAHFGQGTGMRLTQVIQNIKAWFGRVVYDRDHWDEELEQHRILLAAARGCVWLTRRILLGLMLAGHAISCFMLRQMEFDADSYEVKLAGSDAFESTDFRIRELNAAMQLAIEEVHQAWSSRWLPENLPSLVLHTSGALPPETRQKLADANNGRKTEWFDTHPCDTDRRRAARALNEPGIFRLRRPASELFADFEETSRVVTRHHYEKVLGLEFTAQDLVSSEETIREVTVNWQAQAALRRIYGEVNPILAPLLHGQAFPGVLDHPCPMAEWQRARNQTDLLRPDAEKASAECIQRLQALVDLTAARHLAAANLTINPALFGLPDDARTVEAQRTAAQNRIEESWIAVQEHVRNMEPFVASVRTRLSLALLMGGEAAHEVQAWVPALTAVGQVMPVVHQVAGRLRAFTLLMQYRDHHSDPSDADAQLSLLAQELRDFVAQMQSALGAVPHPFPHPRGVRSVADFLRNEQAGDTALEAVHRNSDAHVARIFELHGRLLSRLVVLADRAERGLAAHGDPSSQDPSAAHQPPQ